MNNVVKFNDYKQKKEGMNMDIKTVKNNTRKVVRTKATRFEDIRIKVPFTKSIVWSPYLFLEHGIGQYILIALIAIVFAAMFLWGLDNGPVMQKMLSR